MIVLWIILAALCLFLAILVIRTLRFRPQPLATVEEQREVFDQEKAVQHLKELIRCRTVSYSDKSLEDDGEFSKLYQKLPGLYPNVFRCCEQISLGDRSLLFRWKGKTSEKPGVLMAHFDVVPVNENDWTKPAFEGIIEDGILWGRGTLDTKGTFNGVLEAADNLIAEGFVPAHDLYLAFAGDEEISGDGAPTIVRWMEEHGIRPDFVLDEGGAVVTKVFPGVTQPAAVVGIAEKGPMNVRFVLKTAGGHASTPPSHSQIGILSDTVKHVEANPFPFTLTKPAAQMFDTLARHSTFAYRMIFANLWCFRPVLDMLCKKSGGELNALVRTTVAFTQMSGSAAPNVLPPEAWVGANLRIMCGETTKSVCDRLQSLVTDERIRVEMLEGMDPSAVSETDCEPWQRLSDSIRATWTDAVVTPYLMLACSDSRHYGRISNHVYRFSAMALSKEERGMIHGNNERIPLETIVKTVAFYQRLIRSC